MVIYVKWWPRNLKTDCLIGFWSKSNNLRSRSLCKTSVWPKLVTEPRAKNPQLKAKPVAGFTAVRAADRGPRKAKRRSRQLITNTAGGRKSLSKREQKSGLNWELSNGDWNWMGSFNLVKPDALQTFNTMTSNLTKADFLYQFLSVREMTCATSN